MIESCFGNHLNVQHATDYMGTYLMYLWAINVIVIIDWNGTNSDAMNNELAKEQASDTVSKEKKGLLTFNRHA